MDEQPDPQNDVRRRGQKIARKALHLTGREYLPMLTAISFWAICAITIGHADTARLLSVTVLLRAIVMLVDLTTIGPLRARVHAPPRVRRRSHRTAALIQLGSLAIAGLLVAAISYGLAHTGAVMMAVMLPLAAIGLPARAYRATDTKASSTYFRLIVGLSMLVAGGLAWIIHGGPEAMAIAYGSREWVATIVLRLFLPREDAAKVQIDTTLKFAEVAKTTVVTSRRLLTYRLTKNILTVFGPFGNFAARTGRGLNWHSRLEPYMPHRLYGFVLFAVLTGGTAIGLVVWSGEPAAMILAAGLMQLCAIAINVLILWRYLPRRDDPDLVIDESEDE